MFDVNTKLETGQEFLNRLQSIYGEATVNQRSRKSVAFVWDIWDKQGISKPKNLQEVTSDPFGVFKGYYDDIVSLCDIDMINVNNMYFAYVPTRDLKAYAVTAENNDHVIIFDQDLIHFNNTFIITVLVAVYNGIGKSKGQTLRLDQFMSTLLHDFYHGFQNRSLEAEQKFEDFYIRDILQLDYQMAEYGSYFGVAFTVFIICHEMAHHALGHSKEKRMYEFNVGGDALAGIPVDTPAHQEEYDADEYAYRLFLELIDKKDLATNAILAEAFNRAPLILLEILDIAHLYIEKKTNIVQQSDSHPPPALRKRRLVQIFKSELHEHGLELYEGFMGYAEHIREQLTTDDV